MRLELPEDYLVSPERRRLLKQAGMVALFCCLPRSLYGAEPAQAYRETIGVLQTTYANEFMSESVIWPSRSRR